MKPSTPSDDFNPYAAPAAALDAGLHEPGSEHGVWRAGNDLIMSRDGVLPDRCMKCNEPANGLRLKRKLSWHPQGYFLLVLISPLLYIIVAMIVRKTATVRFPLCPAHRRRRRRMIGLGWLLALGAFPVGIACSMLASHVQGPLLDPIALGGVGLAVVMVIAGLIVGFTGARLASTTKIDKQYVWLSKLGPEFVASLPPYGT